MNKGLSVLIVSVVLFVFSSAFAAVPQTINYQGYLTDTSGTPLTGSYEMVFSLCDAATGGNCPWTETKSVSVNKGILSVVLGSVTPITLSFDVQYYLDIQVGGEQMTTRQPLTSVGYAFRAKEADAVAAGSITNSSISDTAAIDVSKVSGLGSLATKSTVSSADITNGTILDEDISDAAGIQVSKISGLGSLATKNIVTSTEIQDYTITNNDVAAGLFPNIIGVGTLTDLTVSGNANLATTSGAVGIKTTSPRASLEVGGTDGLLVTGTYNSGTARALGAGVRMHWYPRKGAFRVGMAETTYWDDDGTLYPKLALYSIGMGYQPRATAVASTAIGAYNYATGDYSLALGAYNQATASHAIAIGTQVYATGIYSMAFGAGADTNGKDGAMVFGDDSYFQTAHAQGENSITMRFSGIGGVFTPYAYKFMTGYPEETSPNVYMVHNDSAWRSSCSRDLKENFTPVDGEWILGKIRDLPITEWNYKVSDPSVKYIGPVAEDFWDAFHLGGTDNKGISSIAIEGVNLAGVQALEKRTAGMKAEIAELKSVIEVLSNEIEKLKAQLAAK